LVSFVDKVSTLGHAQLCSGKNLCFTGYDTPSGQMPYPLVFACL
jgi:hypothetical protein